MIRESQLSRSEAGIPCTGRTKPSVPKAQTLLSIQTMAILSRQRFFAPSSGNLGFPVDELSSFLGAHLQGVRNAKQGLTVGDSLTVSRPWDFWFAV